MSNPKLSHACGILNIDPKGIKDIRLVYEGEEPCKIYARKAGKFETIKTLSISEFCFIVGLLVFGDVNRFESGIDASSERPLIIDSDLGRIISIGVDIPNDTISLVTETNSYSDSFSDWHEDILRSRFTVF